MAAQVVQRYSLKDWRCLYKTYVELHTLSSATTVPHEKETELFINVSCKLFVVFVEAS